MAIETFGDNTGDDHTGTNAAQMYSGSPNDVLSTLDLGKYATENRVGLIKFDLSSLPSGITVNSAVLYAYLVDAGGGGSHVFTARRLLQNWVTAQTTWTDYATATGWNTLGALGSGTDIAAATTSTSEVIPDTTGVYYELIQDSAQFRTDIENIANSINPNYGWRIERTDGSNDSTYRVFTSYTGTHMTDGQRPYLVVDYTAGGASTARNPFVGKLGSPLRGKL